MDFWIAAGRAYGQFWGSIGLQVSGCKGQPVYQSEPCPEAEKRWDTQPSTTTWDDYYKRQAAERKIAADRRHMRVRAREISAGEGPVGTSVSTPNADACARAKAARAQAYEAMGTKRSFEASRRWDETVWDACK